LTRLIGLLEWINRTVGLTVRWLALVMVLIQFVVVLLRYVFGVSDIALNESVLYLHATLFMLGAGYTLMVDEHVRVDIFYARASEKNRARIDLWGHLLFLMPAMGMLLYWSWPTVRNAWAIREGAISVGGIPASFLLKTLLPLFCILLLLQSVACVLRALITLDKDATHAP
jgi:TRAP-type mannitol/chloroaromatic compound transport system permease small subunit